MRRNENLSAEYFEKLYADITALYRLDGGSAVLGDKAELGELPPMSKVLIGTLAGIWVLIGIAVLTDKLKKRKKTEKP